MAHYDERRRLPRRRTRLSAVAVFGPNDETVACTVRDKSETGAKILPDPGSILPDAFDLIELTTGERHRAKVVWRDTAFVGVTLHERALLSAPATAEDRRYASLRERLVSKAGARRTA
jgi:hypothetical protein